MATETLTKTAPEGQVGRRGFLKTAASGFTLSFFMPSFDRLGEAAVSGTQMNSWINIGTDESVTISVGCSEMGQGSMSSMPQILGEELMVDWSKIRTVQVAPSLAYVTAGSSSVRSHYQVLRQIGAAARELLIQAAMNAMGDQNRANYVAASGVVTNKVKNISLTYGQLAPAAAALPVPAITPTWPPLTPDSQFRLIGQPLPRLDIPSKTDGSAVYGLDVRIPGMMYAVIKHCPSFGGTLAKMPAKPSGAIAVVPTSVIAATARGSERAGNVNAVAVVGSDTWITWQMAKRLSVSWNLPATTSSIDSGAFLTQAQQLMTGGTPYVPGGANRQGRCTRWRTSVTRMARWRERPRYWRRPIPCPTWLTPAWKCSTAR
jgi:isoquinoline 1-oxidoreductase beta subunit